MCKRILATSPFGLFLSIYPSATEWSADCRVFPIPSPPPKPSSSSPSPSPSMAAAAAAATTSFATLVSRGASSLSTISQRFNRLTDPYRVARRPSRARRGSGLSSPPRPPPRRSSPSAAAASPHRPSPSPGASRRRPPTAARASPHPPAPSPRYHLYAAGLPPLSRSSFLLL